MLKSMDLGKSKELLGWKGVQGWTMDPPVDDEGMLNQSPLKRTLGCPRKLGSMVSKWVITPIYLIYR